MIYPQLSPHCFIVFIAMIDEDEVHRLSDNSLMNNPRLREKQATYELN